MSLFFYRKLYSLICISPSRILSKHKNWSVFEHSSLEPFFCIGIMLAFLCIGIMLLVFKIEKDILQENDSSKHSSRGIL